ncbi:MAG: hypothetical protein CVU59_06925 [Deltaproteobacteria bacterium HGW-Deltaproteobacteria-17]|nr:MAG: hypothetical protein CVU59_06925 [Deltaproteobacteria bacterium HGW-Deltaproteobacteria-17]
MARPVRIKYEGALYHVLSRGNRGDFIFPENHEKDRFLSYMEEGCRRYRVICYAYCVMGNHFHLLLRTLQPNLSEFMHFLCSSYASFLRREGWIGHIFAGRFQSICVEDTQYRLALTRYIHLNPMRASMVKNPREYPWSSLRFYTERGACPPWLNVSWLEEEYGLDPEAARQRYAEMMSSPEGGSPILGDALAHAILGSATFVQKLARQLAEDDVRWTNHIGKSVLTKSVDLDELAETVCRYYGISALNDESEPNKKLRRAKQTFIYLARETTPRTGRQIMDLIDSDRSSATTSYHYRQALRALQQDSADASKWRDELQQIIDSLR